MILWLIIILIAGFIGFGVFLYFAQTRMVFFPSRDMAATPSDIGLEYEEVWVRSVNGKRVHGWYIPPPSDSEDAPVVLFCHGNAGNISHRLETVEYLQELGSGILLFDYQGYGKSEGSPGEDRAYEDAVACFDWLVEERNVSPLRIVIFGRSLGGAIAVEVATRKQCRGVVVESSFTSATDMAKKMFPFFPVQVLVRYGFDSVEKIAGIGCPLLVTHSPDDDMIPFEMGQRLFEAAGPPKKFVELNGGHNSREYFDLPAYRLAFKELLDGRAGRWR